MTSMTFFFPPYSDEPDYVNDITQWTGTFFKSEWKAIFFFHILILVAFAVIKLKSVLRDLLKESIKTWMCIANSADQ